MRPVLTYGELERSREAPRQGALAASGGAVDRDDARSGQLPAPRSIDAPSAARASDEARERHVGALDAVDLDGPTSRERRHGERHRHAVVAVRVAAAAFEPAARPPRGRRPRRRRARREPRMPAPMPCQAIGFLHPQLTRARGTTSPTVRARRARRAPAPRRSRAEARRPRPAPACDAVGGEHVDVTDGLAELLAVDVELGVDAHAGHHLEEVRPRRIETRPRRS